MAFVVNVEYARNVNWENDLILGGKSEEIFASFMTGKGYKVQDCSLIKEYQDIDVDFICTNDKGTSKLVEVKRDKTLANFKYEKRRLCFEEISSIYGTGGKIINSIGWFGGKCKADYIVIHDGSNYMYMYSLKDLREYVLAYYEYAPQRVIKYTLGNSRMIGVYQKKLDEWLIENNRKFVVIDLSNNLHKSYR